jgi:flagellin-specific chaperone FliS
MYAKETDKPNSFPSSRVEMLLDLLRATQQCVDQVLCCAQEGRSSDAYALRSRGLVLLGTLQSGVHADGSQMNASILQLYEFVQHCLLQGEPTLLESARSVLQQLIEGFESIRGEAERLEQSGQIPPLVASAFIDTAC